MPGMDGTGPFGDPNWSCRRTFRMGAGFRGGFGRGAGFRQGFAAQQSVTLDKAEQKKILEAELKQIESEKEAIEKRLKEIA